MEKATEYSKAKNKAGKAMNAPCSCHSSQRCTHCSPWRPEVASTVVPRRVVVVSRSSKPSIVTAEPQSSCLVRHNSPIASLPHWKALVALSDAELAARDVAELNLACAGDLPQAPTAEQIAECFARLDKFASAVADFTQKSMRQFERAPQVYDGSPGKFRMVCLVSVLQKTFQVLYNPAVKDPAVPLRPPDRFLHGPLVGAGGCCASLPVVYVAVGRRLGYPLPLAATTRHLFCRWEDGFERFNFDANDTSMDSKSDEYYYASVPTEESKLLRQRNYLQSLSPRGELAHFLLQVGAHWLEAGNYAVAIDRLMWALTLVPGDFQILHNICRAFRRWEEKLNPLVPAGMPEIRIGYPANRYPESVPEVLQREFVRFAIMEETLLNPVHEERWWRHLRNGMRSVKPPIPTLITVNLPK